MTARRSARPPTGFPSKLPKTVLTPGDKVRSLIVEIWSGVYSKKECKPKEVDGLRAYIPDESRSQFVAHPTTARANVEIHLIAHNAYR